MTDLQQILDSPVFHEFLRNVQEKLVEQMPDVSVQRSSLQAEKTRLEQQCLGWRLSLSNPNLSPVLRSTLENDITQAIERKTEIDTRLGEIESSMTQHQAAVDASAVAERLAHLGEILVGDNASATNVILAQHIEGIYCDLEGKVVVRLCQLGALGNPSHFSLPWSHDQLNGRETDTAIETTGRRRRTRRVLGPDFHDDDEVIDAANDFAVDPERFAGLGPEWFTEDEFQVPLRLSWAEEHARDVAEYRLQTHATMQATAEHFGKTIPTIRAALKHAREIYGIDAFGKTVSAPNRAFWPRDNARAVSEFFSQPGATMKDAVQFFGKSDTWIRMARQLGNTPEPDSGSPPT